jgi:5-hydroxyisourate hydrolase-like protein (transthyretin family)
MVHKTTLILLVFCGVLSFGAQRKDSPTHDGEVSGIVLTEEGLPAVDFQVCTQVHAEQSGFERTETCCSARTNSEGRFTITDLKPGTYELLATNDAEGYSIGNQLPGQVVAIDVQHSRPSVTIRLHNRGPVVVAHIIDKSTGKPLDDAHLQYSGVDCDAGGDVLRGFQGQYSLPIPTDCDVMLIARAKGYRGWVYTDDESSSRPVLRLAAGQRKVLDIHLEPTGTQPSQR